MTVCLSNLKSLTLQDCGINDTSIAYLAEPVRAYHARPPLQRRQHGPRAVANQAKLTSLLLYGNPLAGSTSTQTWYASLSGKLLTVDIAPQDTSELIAKINPADPNSVTATYTALAAAFYNLPMEIYQYLDNTMPTSRTRGR